jgi:hypothetical protein
MFIWLEMHLHPGHARHLPKMNQTRNTTGGLSVFAVISIQLRAYCIGRRGPHAYPSGGRLKRRERLEVVFMDAWRPQGLTLGSECSRVDLERDSNCRLLPQHNDIPSHDFTC